MSSGSATAFANVAVLDDEQEEAQKLQEVLESEGNNVITRTDMRSAEVLLENSELDAASIDWEWNSAERGADLLTLIEKAQPEAARVVYTKHERRLRAAQYYGADFFVVKSGDGSVGLYQETMRNAVRLGLARRILKCLSDAGVANLPNLQTREELPDKVERALYRAAASFAIRELGEGKGTHMRDLLVRRGWIGENNFNRAEFRQLQWNKKLMVLSQYADIALSDLTQILSASTQSIENLFANTVRLDGTDRSLLSNSDQLLSVLAYVLRLCEYDSGMMPLMWRVPDLFAASLEHPPWEPLGLAEYLKANGPNGLSESLKWIRSH